MVPPYGYNSRKNTFLPPYSHAVLTSMGCTRMASDSATKFSEQSKYLILLPLAPFEVLSKFALHFVCGHPS